MLFSEWLQWASQFEKANRGLLESITELYEERDKEDEEKTEKSNARLLKRFKAVNANMEELLPLLNSVNFELSDVSHSCDPIVSRDNGIITGER